MQYFEIMVRYGELSTKGKNRQAFIGRLHGNIVKALHEFPALTIRPKRDRLHIELNGEEADRVMARLSKVFGIQSYSASVKVEKAMPAVHEAVLALMADTVPTGASYKVNTRRSDHSFALDTNAMNLDVGDFLTGARPDLTVRMKDPDYVLRVEVRKDAIYLSTQTMLGAGGLPVGTAGKAMLMLSGGIDSPVAGYYALKRGVEIEMVHFFSPPYTTDSALAKAKQLTTKLAPYVGAIRFLQVPFTEIQETIKATVPEGYLMTIQRRLMLRLTAVLAEKRRALAIVNGESIGQVASQTLESMVAINDVTTMPIIRPVATMDKNEIIKVATDIDTYNLSIMPFEDCCTIFAPPTPKTKPNLDKARYYESKLDVAGLMERALDGVVTSEIRASDEFMMQDQELITELL